MEVGKFLKNKLNLLKGQYEGKDIDVDKVMKRVDKNKDVFINRPYSDRTFTRNAKGSFIGGDMLIGNEKESHPDSEVVSLPSTAIADVAYNPEDEVATIKFVGGEGTYDYKVTPKEFNDFMNAPSKGRHVAKLWNHNEHFHI
ncbi:MAG: KTSC domain-containing protein [Bacteroidales bacterium]|nr:KTSC domain-containing protein [Bacteroidales bacterium]